MALIRKIKKVFAIDDESVYEEAIHKRKKSERGDGRREAMAGRREGGLEMAGREMTDWR